MKLFRRAFLYLAAAVALPASSGVVWAQSYPSRPITIVVPYPAGGPTDTIARLLAERMKLTLGGAFVIENIGGAGGRIGVGHAARAPSDGYTLSIGHVQTHVLNALTMKLDYDVVNDFSPISLIADTPVWIVGRKSLPADDLKGFISWLKASDGKATMGTVGIGGPPDIAAINFQKSTGTTFQFVTYRGGAPMVQDLLGGHVDFAFGQAAGQLSNVRAGQLKVFAVLAPKRWWAVPELPTLDELGVPGLHATFWHGIWAPRGAPQEIVARLNSAIREALADAKVQERFRDIGQEVWPQEEQTPAALVAKQRAELSRWSPIIKEAGIKVE